MAKVHHHSVEFSPHPSYPYVYNVYSAYTHIMYITVVDDVF
jgi:hypothetical protein